jgi:hypothetical protein
VTIYISDFRRPLAERLAKDFFSDPAQASVACVRTGPVTMRKVREHVCVGLYVRCGTLRAQVDTKLAFHFCPSGDLHVLFKGFGVRASGCKVRRLASPILFLRFS